MGLVKGFCDCSLITEQPSKEKVMLSEVGFLPVGWDGQGGAGVRQVIATQVEAGAELHFMI